MKKIARSIAALLGALVIAGSAAAQGIPVIDATSILNLVKQLEAWKDQYDQMVQQYQMMTNQLNAVTGSRGMGQLMNLPGMRQQLPMDFVNQFERLRSQGAAGATPEASAIYQKIKTFDCASQYPNDQASRLACEANAMVAPTNASLVNQALQSSQGRVQQLQGLIDSIDTAQDAKAAQDLSNRIAAEQAMLQNEKMMVELALAQQERQARLLDQQKREAGLKRLTESTFNPFAGALQ